MLGFYPGHPVKGGCSPWHTVGRDRRWTWRPDVEVLALNHLLAHEPRNWRWLLGPEICPGREEKKQSSQVPATPKLRVSKPSLFQDVGSIGFHLFPWCLRRAASENPQLENGIADWSGLEESCLTRISAFELRKMASGIIEKMSTIWCTIRYFCIYTYIYIE